MSRFPLPRWIWAAVAVVLLWVVLSIASGHFSLNNVSGIAVSASFLAIASLGQAFAVSTGRANIDLSVGSVVTLGAFVTVRLAGAGVPVPLATLAAILMGVVVGILNGTLVSYMRIPAIIATLAVGYVLATAAQIANEGLSIPHGGGMLDAIANGTIAGIPAVLILAVALCLVSELVLNRLGYGRMLLATGQSERAAALAGIKARGVTVIAFAISGALAGLAGALLSARSGGAFLDMGTPYLIQSIGAVVVGGTAIIGGATTFFGTLLGAVFLVMIVTAMQVMRLPIGYQEVIEGIIIILVLLGAGGAGRLRARPAKTGPATA